MLSGRWHLSCPARILLRPGETDDRRTEMESWPGQVLFRLHRTGRRGANLESAKRMTPAELQAKAEQYRWYHPIDLGGYVTKPDNDFSVLWDFIRQNLS